MTNQMIAVAIALGGFSVNVLSIAVAIGVYFGYAKAQLEKPNELDAELKAHKLETEKRLSDVKAEFYAHYNDETAHLSDRDWKHLNETLDELKQTVKRLEGLMLKQ